MKRSRLGGISVAGGVVDGDREPDLHTSRDVVEETIDINSNTTSPRERAKGDAFGRPRGPIHWYGQCPVEL